MNKLLKPGDLVIYTCTRPHRVGVIREIELDKWGSQNKVFIHWQGLHPGNYNKEHGYAGINIRNGFYQFKVIRQ